MCLTEYDEKYEREFLRNEGKAEGLAEGRKEGLDAGRAFESKRMDRLVSGLREISEAGKNGSAKSRMDAIDRKYGGSVEQTYRDMTKLSRDHVAWETIKSEMDLAQQAISRIRGEMSSLRKQINSGKKLYEEGLKEYNRNLIELNEQI